MNDQISLEKKTPILEKVSAVLEPIPADSLDASRKQVSVVSQAATIIETLCRSTEPLRMTVISRLTGLAPSSCFNILRTLSQEGIVRFDSTSKLYSLDLGLVGMVRNMLTPGGSLRVVSPILEEFVRLRGVTLVIWRRSGEHMMVVTYFDHGSAIRVHIEQGARLPIMGGAMGRIMAFQAGLSDQEVKELFARVKWDEKISLAQFLSEGKLALERGWALDTGQLNAGITSVSAPIKDGFETVDAVLSATMFVGQHDSDTIEIIAEELIQLSKLLASVKVGRAF